MAHIIRGARNHLQDELSLWKKRRRWTAVVSILGVFMFLGGPMTGRPTVSLLGLVVALVAYMWNRKIHTTIEVVRTGLEGEENAEKVFSELPMEYTVYSDLSIVYDGKASQIDHVVVGPNGIFVVETKNMNGEIHGLVDEHEWTQVKTGRQGASYENKFYNPVKQVGTHVYRLAGLLKSTHIHAWVQGVVYFSNAEAVVHTTGGKIPVFACSADGAHAMKTYILTYDGESIRQDTKRQLETVLRQTIMVEGA